MFGKVYGQNIFKSVEIDTLLTGEISIRSLVADGSRIWYADKGKYGFIDIYFGIQQQHKVSYNNLFPEFRSVAQTTKMF